MRPQVTLALICLGACTQTPPPPPPPANVCVRDLSGMWRHAADPSYQWHIADDRTRVELHPVSGTPDPNDPHAHHHGARDGEARITLVREGKTLAGRADSRARTMDGSTECAVSFRAQVDSCGESEIVLSMEQSYDVGPDCKRAAADHEPDMVTHRLVRAP